MAFATCLKNGTEAGWLPRPATSPYRIFDPVKAAANAEAIVEPESEAKVRTPSDLTPQIAAGAYELYQRLDWRFLLRGRRLQ
jgi:hypothetical protein